MRSRFRRGSLLLTAIGVAIVLFLLSVALVSMNREDIQLTLFMDHRLHAQMAARAAAAYALQTMRSDAHWEDKVEGFKGKMEDGAEWSAQVSPYPDPDQTESLYEIDGVGGNGFVSEHYRMVVEEVKMVSHPTWDRVPLLFGYTTDGSLAMLQSTFQWTMLGPPPNYGAWLAAHDGPLFTYGPAKSGQGLPPLQGPSGQPIPPPVTLHEHLVQLEFTDNVATWLDIPDPGPILGKVYGGVTNGVLTAGQSVSWYGLVGQALAANQGLVYAHAYHYFYQGGTAQSATSQGNMAAGGQKTPGKLFQAPALLQYDSTRGAWQILADHLKVIDPHSSPQIVGVPVPDFGSLGVVMGAVYCLNSSGQSVLSTGGGLWQVGGTQPGVTEGLYDYDGRLAVHLARNGFTFADVDPGEELKLAEPAMYGDVWDPVEGAFKQELFRNKRDVHVNIMASSKHPIIVNDDSNFAGYRPLADGGNPQISFAGDKSIADGGNTMEHAEADKPISEGGNTMAPYAGYDGGSNALTASPDMSFNQSNDPTYAPDDYPEGQPGIQAVATVTPSYGGNQVATLGEDFVTFARVRLNGYNSGDASPNRTTTTLIHYDGKHWQIWPGGLHALSCSPTSSDSAYPMIGNDFQMQTENLAWAVYDGKNPLLRRYVPILIQRGGK